MKNLFNYSKFIWQDRKKDRPSPPSFAEFGNYHKFKLLSVAKRLHAKWAKDSKKSSKFSRKKWEADCRSEFIKAGFKVDENLYRFLITYKDTPQKLRWFAANFTKSLDLMKYIAKNGPRYTVSILTMRKDLPGIIIDEVLKNKWGKHIDIAKHLCDQKKLTGKHKKRIYQLFKDSSQFEWLHTFIFRTSIPPDMLEKMAYKKYKNVGFYITIAYQRNIKASTLDYLSTLKQNELKTKKNLIDLKGAIAKNPNTSRATLVQLSMSGYDKVMYWVAQHRNTPKDVLTGYVKNKDKVYSKRVIEAAKESLRKYHGVV